MTGWPNHLDPATTPHLAGGELGPSRIARPPASTTCAESAGRAQHRGFPERAGGELRQGLSWRSMSAETPPMRELHLIVGFDGSPAATRAHLRLLRPSLATVEQAMAAETQAASGAEAAAIAVAGINRFLSQHQQAGS